MSNWNNPGSHHIAVDLIPLLAPGQNEGGKLTMIRSLLSALPRLLPDGEITLLTSGYNHAELACLEKGNMRRVCALPNGQLHRINRNTGITSSKAYLKQTFSRLLPSSLVRWSKYRLRPIPTILARTHFDLLFCPFTVPYFCLPDVPVVSVIYDLQFFSYPQFFSPTEVFYQRQQFDDCIHISTHIIANSEYVRQSVLRNAPVEPEHISTIPISLTQPVPSIGESENEELLHRLGLKHGHFLFYPANFGPHKNHAMLLTAFSMFRRAHPGSTLKLLCTGMPGHGSEAFCEAARRMGLGDWVIYPGYVTSSEYDVLLRSAFAMIFPSLYEGLGMPILEAMSVGVPVLCSNVTSLPELGDDAVLYFDPRRPAEIVEVLTRLSQEPNLHKSLIAKGLQRASLFEGLNRMATQYIDVFGKVLRATRP